MFNSAQFVAAFYNKRAGDHVRLELLHGSRRWVVEMPVLDHEVESERSPGARHAEYGLLTRLGVMCVPLKPHDQASVSGLRSNSGVLVVAKLAASGSRAHLIAGDVVRSVNGVPVLSLDLLRSMIDKLEPGEAAVLQIERRGQFKYIAIEIN